MDGNKALYVPALRMKAGELAGLRMLENDIASHVFPRLIIPPLKERDRKLQQELMRLPDEPSVHGMLSLSWTDRPVLLQASHLLREIGATAGRWLPALFEKAHDHSVLAIPAFTADEALSYSAAIKMCLPSGTMVRFGLIIRSGEIVDPAYRAKALSVLDALAVRPDECIVLADFSDADLSAPKEVGPVIRGTLEDLQDLARWQLIAFQGTSYPEHNPADHGLTFQVSRAEWLAWKLAVQYDPSTANELLFGDFSADCARLNFGKGGARAIRHLRYTTEDSWYVVRAREKGRDAELMRDVCSRITSSSWFDGRDYSAADNEIFRLAGGLRGPGTATDWRALNTGRHITRCIRDLGAVKGFSFERLHAGRLEQAQEKLAL